MQQYNTSYSNAHRAPMAAPMHKRPRFHPAAIIIMVLAIGLIFVGLVMTIISVWPGYTPMGGNPLKIVGPILLCVGFAVLCATIAYSCIYSKKKNQAMMDLSRSTLASNYAASHHGSHLMTSSRQQLAPHTPTPSVDAKPSKSILKKTSSTSTYNGTAPSDSGRDRSRDSDVSSGSGSMRMDGIQVSMKPDPHNGYGNHAYQPDYRNTQHYNNAAYDGYDQHNTSGSLANTSMGSNSASQSLVGMGMLSPLAATSQPRTQPPSAKTKSWGQTRTGVNNRSYESEHFQQSVSTVSTTYQQYTTPQRPTTAKPQRSTAPHDSSSTEV